MTLAPPLKSLLLWIVVGYALLVVLAALFQRHLMFFPSQEPFVPTEWQMVGVETLDIKTGDGLSLHSWYRPPASPDKKVIVFFQGNAGNLGHREYKVRPWMDSGFGVLLVGYRGYGGNPGSPSEKGLYNDARAAIDFVRNNKRIPDNRIVLYGESIGTGVATQMASEYKVAAMILEAPFTSLADVGAAHYPYLPVRLIATELFDSYGRIGQIHVPLLLMHGEKDTVVPFAQGQKLFAAANEPKQTYYEPRAGHNDLYEWNARAVVAKFLNGLPH